MFMLQHNGVGNTSALAAHLQENTKFLYRNPLLETSVALSS